MADAVDAPDPELIRALRALPNPLRLPLLGWLREPERHFVLDQEGEERARGHPSSWTPGCRPT